MIQTNIVTETIIDNILYILNDEPYEIEVPEGVEQVYVPLDYYDAYAELNPGISLNTYNTHAITVNPPVPYDYTAVIATKESNANLLSVLYTKGLCSNENYMTLAEAKAVTNEKLDGLLNGNKTVQTFHEFQYFTGVTKICSSDDAEASKTLSPFKGCTTLKEITFPPTVKELGARAFDQTKGVNIINGLENIHIFGHCSLQGTFGNSSTQNFDTIIVDELKGGNQLNNVFKATNGYGIKNLIIGEGIEDIPVSAFFKLYNLESLTLPDSLITIGEEASNAGSCFTGCIKLKRLNSDVDGVINIPNNVTRVGYQAFYCAGATDVTGNNYINEINIPDSVTIIGTAGFGGFYKCERINIGTGIETLGTQSLNNAGKDSEHLTITIKATTPPTWDGALITADKVDIYVPADSVDAYKAATGWSYYADKIQAIPE